MAIKRRTFLAAASAGLASRLSLPAERNTSARWLSAFRAERQRYGIAVLDDKGQLRQQVPLPGRVHAAVMTPAQHSSVVIARRPGIFAAVLDLVSGQLQTLFNTAPGRHFYGHGAFSRDGELLFTTENDFNTERGVIGIRSARQNYRYLGEWPSHGIGPHELVLSPDGASLIIANGGILTHPDSGRTRLNLPTMSPSIVRLDARTGELLAELRLPARLHQLSIRHLAVTPTDDVVFGMQNAGPLDTRLPLVGLWQTNGSLSLWNQDLAPLRQGYIGSVAIDVSGALAATSAPRDNQVLFWTIATGRCCGHLKAADACGVAAAERPGSFWISTGAGRLFLISIDAQGVHVNSSSVTSVQWDNHLTFSPQMRA